MSSVMGNGLVWPTQEKELKIFYTHKKQKSLKFFSNFILKSLFFLYSLTHLMKKSKICYILSKTPILSTLYKRLFYILAHSTKIYLFCICQNKNF